tara:strand:+ start:122 stop:334 length:213 start_codon:yes stop_codon:yes gene_type:complete
MKQKMGTKNTAAYEFYIACGLLLFVYIFCKYYYKKNSSELLETTIIPTAIIIQQQDITDIDNVIVAISID